MVAEPQRYQPRRITPAEAAAARVLSVPRRPVAADGLVIAFAPAASPVEPVTLGLNVAGEPAVLHTAPALLTALLARLDPAAPQADAALRPLLIELALEPALAAAGPRAPDLVVRADAPAAPTAWRLAGSAAVLGGPTADFALDLGPAGMTAMAGALAPLTAIRRPIPGLPIPLRVRALATDLALRDLREAQAGDVILAEPPGTETVLLVAGERIVWRARREASMVRLESRRLSPQAAGLTEWLMDAPDEPAQDHDDPDLATLPVRVVFELGRLQIPLGDLESLGPGYVFELGRDPAQPVDILANGKRVGQGEIVSVGDALGVRIMWIGGTGGGAHG